MQTVSPTALPVPGAHAVHALEPTAAAYEPARHTSHVLELVAPTAALALSAAHGVQNVFPRPESTNQRAGQRQAL